MAFTSQQRSWCVLEVHKTNLMEYFYKYWTADTLTQEIFNFPAHHQRAVKCKMAFTSQQRSWCVLEVHKTNSVVTVQRAFKLKLNVDPLGYVKDRVYVPPLPATVDELQERITAAVNSVTSDMLQRVWSELDYRIDVCRVTRVCVIPHETV
jgi:hypothetical protein